MQLCFLYHCPDYLRICAHTYLVNVSIIFILHYLKWVFHNSTTLNLPFDERCRNNSSSRIKNLCDPRNLLPRTRLLIPIRLMLIHRMFWRSHLMIKSSTTFRLLLRNVHLFTTEYECQLHTTMICLVERISKTNQLFSNEMRQWLLFWNSCLLCYNILLNLS